MAKKGFLTIVGWKQREEKRRLSSATDKGRRGFSYSWMEAKGGKGRLLPVMGKEDMRGATLTRRKEKTRDLG